MDIETCLDLAVRFLQENQKKNGSICLVEDSEWNIWETVISLQTLQRIENVDSTVIEDALKFILDSQRVEGSYYHKVSFQKEEYCMETTALCIDALGTSGLSIDKGLHFLIKNQQSDGSWEIGNPYITKYRDFPSVTGFVLRTLLNHRNSSEHVEKGINYLKQTQLDDGSWGCKWMYYDTPFYPMHVILEVFKLYGMQESEEFRNAIDYIISTQDDDGSWCVEKKNREKPSVELRTSLALYSLLVHPNNGTIDAIEKGVKWLMDEQQPDGKWDGGIFVGWHGKHEDIFVTAMSISVLKKYLDLKKKFFVKLNKNVRGMD